ncbi:MAG: hypothetical protein EXR11_08025 [Rhodospirillaceae bacterium]|nr:hypothetical protein [Rhodospirillaceae bacterium]
MSDVALIDTEPDLSGAAVADAPEATTPDLPEIEFPDDTGDAPLELPVAAKVKLSSQEQMRAALADEDAPAFEPPGATNKLGPRPTMTAKAAVNWFLHDMAEVSGFILSGFSKSVRYRCMPPTAPR